MSTTPRRVTCPGCQTSYRIPENVSAPAVRCKKCSSRIPLSEEAPAAQRLTPMPARHRPTTGRVSRAPTDAIRGRRTQIAMGMRTRERVKPLYLAMGLVCLAAVAAAVALAI